MLAHWPLPDGREEYAVRFNRGRKVRLLVLPALFDEANKLRHFTIETMRLLDTGGVDCVLPDLPGCNESLSPLAMQDLETWREAAATAARHFDVTHVLSLRGGALAAPDGVPGWAYAPVTGKSLLSTQLRARVLAAREAGQEENRESLLAAGLAKGLVLAGHELSHGMIAQLHAADPTPWLTAIPQSQVGGPGLWLRAEPDTDTAQAEALADIILSEIGA